MVDVSHDAWEFEAANGRGPIRVCGPSGKAVGDEHSRKFWAELKRLLAAEEGIEIYFRDGGNSSIYVPDSGHAYWVYSVLGQDADIDTDLWKSNTVLTYATDDNGYYDVLCERDKIGVWRNPEFCAAAAVNAVKAHRNAGFTQIPCH